MRQDEHRPEAHTEHEHRHRHRYGHKYRQHLVYMEYCCMLSYYSADYCGTARNKRLHTSNRQYGVPRRCSTLLCRGERGKRERGSAIKTRMGGGWTHMDGPPRHGTEGVPSRLWLWSLLAAEPAVHEDRTQCLSQIPHRFWFWAPTDTRFWGRKRGRLDFCTVIRTRHVCVSAVLYVLWMYMRACVRSNQFWMDQSAGTDPTDSQPKAVTNDG